MASELAFVAGVLMAVAGSLHCVSQCGAISSSLMLATYGPASAGSSALRLLAMQGGRVAVYILFGTVLGLGGQGLDAVVSFSGLPHVVRVLAATNLVWVGASVAGVGPHLQRFDHVLGGLFRSVRTVLPKDLANASPVAIGLAWGFAPCAMVYAALVNAMLSGSWRSGASFMAGFSLATVPAVMGTAYGMTALVFAGRQGNDRRLTRRVIGVTIAALGVGSMWFPTPGGSGVFCLG